MNESKIMISIPYRLRIIFKYCCYKKGLTMSRIIRELMVKFVEESGEGHQLKEMPIIQEELSPDHFEDDDEYMQE